MSEEAARQTMMGHVVQMTNVVRGQVPTYGLSASIASAYMSGLLLGCSVARVEGGEEFARFLLADVESMPGPNPNIIRTTDDEVMAALVAALRRTDA